MNNLGVNVAQVLDDNQMSYMNNEDYIRMSRVEEYQNKLEAGNFKLSEVQTAVNQDDQGFKPYWGNGIKMNWTLVPLEEQKCHINWRQSINDDGSSLGRLASWMDQASGGGYSMTNPLTDKKKANLYLENQKSMNSNKGNNIYGSFVNSGISFTENKIDLAKTNYMNYQGAVKDAIGSSTDIDSLAVIAAATVKESTNHAELVNEYRKAMNAIGGCQNPGLVWVAMTTSVDIVKMYIEGTLEKWIAAHDNSSDDGSGSTATIPKPKNTIAKPTIKETNLQFTKSMSPMNGVQKITIHHLGGGFDLDAQYIHQKIHIGQNGWAGIGYHYIIRWDGTIERGRPEEYVGAHAEGYNAHNIGINVSGTFEDTNNEGHPDPSDAQIKSLIELLSDICARYNLVASRDVIKGHREYNNTSCPGTNLYKRLDSIVDAVKTGTYLGNDKSETLWTDFVPAIKRGLEIQGKIGTGELDFFPKICFLYTNLMASIKTSQFDGPEWGFPFTSEQMQGWPDPAVYLTTVMSLDGIGTGGRKHEGVDLVPVDQWFVQKGDVPFHAVKDGVVVISGWAAQNGFSINHGDGTFSRYLHSSKLLVKAGDTVKKGQPIGYIGHEGVDANNYHLHLEMGKGDGTQKVNHSTVIDPLAMWASTNGSDGTYKCWTLKNS